MSHWAPLATDLDDDKIGPSRFLLDNDVDVALLRLIQGTGASAVQLAGRFKSLDDDSVLAEAKRQDRVLITHDKRFVDPRSVDPTKNPGIVILPRDAKGRLDLPLVTAVLSHIILSRYSVDCTVVRVYPSGIVTIWNPNEYTEQMEPIHCRVSEHLEVEVWLDEDGDWASSPKY